MSRSKAKIIFFFLLISFLFLGFPLSIVNATVLQNPIIKADWLYVSVGDFKDNTPHPLEKNIVFSPGGIDLLSFNNLGAISQTDEHILYKAEAQFGFELTAYTAVSVRNAFPNLDQDAMVSKKYITWSLVDWTGTCKATSVRYSWWTDVSLGDMVLHDYSGTAPITVGMLEFSDTEGTMIVNGIEFEVPDYVSNTYKTTVYSIESAKLGEYTNKFKNITDEQGITIDYENFDEDMSGADQEVLDYLSTITIGSQKKTEVEEGTVLAQYKCTGSQPGAYFPNNDPVNNRLYTFDLDVGLAPHIHDYTQKVENTEISIGYHPGTTEPIRITFGPSTSTYDRCAGVYIQNYMMRWNFIVDVYFYATVPMTAELSESFLSDPYLQLGDWVWDPSIMSGHLTVITQPGADPFDWFFGLFGGILNFIIIVLVVIVAFLVLIKVVIPYLSRRVKKRQRKER